MKPPEPLAARIDDEASDLAVDADQTYEVAIGIASSAQDYVRLASEVEAATLIRDTFGTWAQVIHTHGHRDGSTREAALHAHSQIAAAVADWTSGGRDDPLTFGQRWRATVEKVDVSWLEEDGVTNVALEQ
jgi:hypothetical protein